MNPTSATMHSPMYNECDVSATCLRPTGPDLIILEAVLDL